jgi:hypothetical protein
MSLRAAEPVAPVTLSDLGETERTYERCRNFGWVLRGRLRTLDFVFLDEQLTGHCARTSSIGMHQITEI